MVYTGFGDAAVPCAGGLGGNGAKYGYGFGTIGLGGCGCGGCGGIGLGSCGCSGLKALCSPLLPLPKKALGGFYSW